MKSILRTALIVLTVIAFDVIRTFPLTGMRLELGMTWDAAGKELSHADYDSHLVAIKYWAFENMIGEWRFSVRPREDGRQKIASKWLGLRIGNSETYWDAFDYRNADGKLSISLLGVRL